jgi:hypothetical protein
VFCNLVAPWFLRLHQPTRFLSLSLLACTLVVKVSALASIFSHFENPRKKLRLFAGPQDPPNPSRSARTRFMSSKPPPAPGHKGPQRSRAQGCSRSPRGPQGSPKETPRTPPVGRPMSSKHVLKRPLSLGGKPIPPRGPHGIP